MRNADIIVTKVAKMALGAGDDRVFIGKRLVLWQWMKSRNTKMSALLQPSRFKFSAVWLLIATQHWQNGAVTVFRVMCEEQTGNEPHLRTRTDRTRSHFIHVQILVEIYATVRVSVADRAFLRPHLRCLTVSRSSTVCFRCQRPIHPGQDEVRRLFRKFCWSSRRQKLSQPSCFLTMLCLV